MFCEKCGNRLGDDAAFCAVCGAKVPSAYPAAPAAQPTAPQHYAYQPACTAPPAPSTAPCEPEAAAAQPVSQPTAPQPYAYQPAYTAPPARQVQSAKPANAKRKQPRIGTGGYIAAIILSALAVGLFFLCIIGVFKDLVGGNFYFTGVMDVARWIVCFIPFFVLCILLKVTPAFLTAIPLLFVFAERSLAALSSVFHFPVFDVEYGFSGFALVCLLCHLAGIVMYLITLLLRSRPLALKIITAVLNTVYAGFLISDFSRGLSFMDDYFGGFDLQYFLGWLGYDFGLVFLLAAMTVIVFTSKGRQKISSY